MTPREPLTRYRNYAGSECYLVADVEARDQALLDELAHERNEKETVREAAEAYKAWRDKRDQAREAEIRALILDAKLVRHNEPGAVIQHPGFMPECPFCIRDLDSLLTPASQEGQTR
jgi:hypothetical protein